MTKLKVHDIKDDNPVTLKVKLPADVHRDLVCYAQILKQQGAEYVDLAALVAVMLAQFMNTDRAFKKARRLTRVSNK